MALVLLVASLLFVTAFGAGSLPMLTRVRANERLLRMMTSLAAGFLLGSAFLIVIPEGMSLVLENDPSATRPPGDLFGLSAQTAAGLALLLGFALMFLLESFGFSHDIHEEHHESQHGHIHHPATETRPGAQLALVVAAGLTLHAFADGLALGAALATDVPVLTASLVLALSMHKLPAAFSLAVFSLHAHGNLRRTWRDLTFFSLATPASLFIAWITFGALSTYWLSLGLMLSAGTFLYVATVDVLPHVIQEGHRRLVIPQVLAGAVAIALLSFLLS